MIAIANFDLFASADNVVSTYANLDPQLHMYFSLLNRTGARANEGLEFERWYVLNEYEIGLKSEKGALDRNFQKTDLQTEFVQAVEQNIDPFTFLSYTQMVRYYQRGLFYLIFYASGRKLNAHLFRYSYIRKLISLGKTEAEIKIILGKPTNADISMYYNRVFYKL